MTLREEMIKVGLDKGIKDGRKEGIKEGESKALKRIVKFMLKEGLSYEKILAYTGMNKKSLKKITKSFESTPQLT